MSVYGRPKTGKTRLIATFPKPVLIIGTEDGTRSIRNVKGVDFVLIEHTSEIPDLCEIAVQKGYATVAVDTCTMLQDMLMKEILGLSEMPVQKSWGIMTQQQWGQLTTQTKELLDRVLRLRCNTIFTAHERTDNNETDSELIMPVVGSSLTPKAAFWLNGAVEYVCQTFIRAEEKEVRVKVAGKEKTVKQRGKGKEYCLRTGPHEVYMTGFRLPPGTSLPDVIVDPSYDKIAAIALGK